MYNNKNYYQMKQMKFLAFLLFAGMTFVACDDDSEVYDLDEENTMTLTFEESGWEGLIDNPQYNGPQLYGENAKDYSWTDNVTKLSGGMTNAGGGLYGFAEGGTAISNYIDADYEKARSYDIQLAIPESNGSKNFAVVYCGAELEFSDGVARELKSIDVIGTTYMLSVAKNGNEYAKPLVGKAEYLNLVITGYYNDEVTGVSRVSLAYDGFVLDHWYTHLLAGLGKVTKITFTMEGSDGMGGYLNTPIYFAFDNVVVKKESSLIYVK